WHRLATALLSNNSSESDPSALTELGDALLAAGDVDAAHTCYLLSPQTSHIGRLGSPSARIVLVGSGGLPTNSFFSNVVSIRLSEIVEMCNVNSSLLSGDKHKLNGLIPHLQEYKISIIWWLIDMGNLNNALRYCQSL
ncbi:hypothetical protein GQ42DRAFT_104978, partial [Ramicandelaber brevisporus]